MIVDKLKEVQLVTESGAIKLDATNGIYQRFDKTVYVQEPFSVSVTGSGEAYVEASKFFSLLPETSLVELSQDYVKMTLKNKAEYKLPKMDVKWDTSNLPATFVQSSSINIKLASGRLTSATLKNLANPMLQCIYMDQDSGVSCNSMVACIDGTTLVKQPILLPPDVVTLMEGRESQLMVSEDGNFIIKIGEAFIVCPAPMYDYSETAEVLRNSIPASTKKYPVSGLFEEIRRLSSFGDFLSFDGNKVSVGENFEPFDFPSAEPTFRYGVQYLLTVLPQVTHISQSEFALLLYGDNFLFMVSPEELQ